MESFKIVVELDNELHEILVIPDDCTDQSVFHLVKNEREFCKLLHSDTKNWEVIESFGMKEEDISKLTQKIEEHYFQ
jgi:hypothetical protein